MRSTPRSLVVSLHQLARTPGPAFLSPGNCSNFDPETPRGRWGCGPFVSAPVSLIQETRNSAQYADIGPYWHIELEIIHLDFFLWIGIEILS